MDFKEVEVDESVKGVTFSKFSHKTKHLSKSQHQLDPNLDLKQLVHHSTVQYVDRDVDGDVDIYDAPKKAVPDENPIKDFGKVSKKLITKQTGELKHTRRGMAYEAIRIPAVYGNIISIILTWRGKSYMTKMFFPNAKMPTRREVKDQIEKVYPGATILTYEISNIQPGEPLIQVTEGYGLDPKFGSMRKRGGRSAPPEERSVGGEMNRHNKDYWADNLGKNRDRGKGSKAKRRAEALKEVAAWQRKEGQNPEGGLNEKGRKSYEAAEPGSDLKAPSKEVGNPRRTSFCARMKGMKKKLTSSKTASDPNSRINKSLRAWNC